jgi:hypothetical protein
MSAPPPPADDEGPPPLPDDPPPPDTQPSTSAPVQPNWVYQSYQYGLYPQQAAPPFQVYHPNTQYAYAPPYYQPSESAYQASRSAYQAPYNPGASAPPSVAAYARLPIPQQAQAHSLRNGTYGQACAPSQPYTPHENHIPGVPAVTGTQNPPSSVACAPQRVESHAEPVSLPSPGGIFLQVPTAPLNTSALEKHSSSSHSSEQLAGRKPRRQFTDAPPPRTQVSESGSGANKLSTSSL